MPNSFIHLLCNVQENNNNHKKKETCKQKKRNSEKYKYSVCQSDCHVFFGKYVNCNCITLSINWNPFKAVTNLLYCNVYRLNDPLLFYFIIYSAL